MPSAVSLVNNRQADDKFRALSFDGRYVYGSAMGFHRAAGDGQPQSGSVLFMRDEEIKQCGQIGGGNARAVVAEPDDCGIRIGAQGDGDCPALSIHSFCGIADQVQKSLQQFIPVQKERRDGAFFEKFDGDTFFCQGSGAAL